MTTEKLPPHDIDSEECVLGSLLIDGEAHWKIHWLKPHDFYREKNRWVYEACFALMGRGEPIDQVTVAHELQRSNRLEAIGGAAYLSHLVSNTPTSVHIEHYAEIVRRTAVCRQLIETASQIAALGYEAGPDVNAMLSKAYELVLTVGGSSSAVSVITPERRAELAWDRYDYLGSLDGGVMLPLGFPTLDAMGGAYPGEVIIIGAYPKVGKTTLLVQMAKSLKVPTLFVSLEMDVAQLDHRSVAQSLLVPINEIRKGNYKADLLELIRHKAISDLIKQNIYIYAPPRASISQIEAEAKKMAMRYGLGAVTVDYLQLLNEAGKSEYERITNVSRNLKGMARSLNVPVIAASQFHRPEGHDVKKPTLFDLRGSGYLEQDADLVLLLHRWDCFYSEAEWEKRWSNYPYPKGKAVLSVAASRQGGVLGDIKLVWRAKRQEYEEVEAALGVHRD